MQSLLDRQIPVGMRTAPDDVRAKPWSPDLCLEARGRGRTGPSHPLDCLRQSPPAQDIEAIQGASHGHP